MKYPAYIIYYVLKESPLFCLNFGILFVEVLNKDSWNRSDSITSFYYIYDANTYSHWVGLHKWPMLIGYHVQQRAFCSD